MVGKLARISSEFSVVNLKRKQALLESILSAIRLIPDDKKELIYSAPLFLSGGPMA